MGVPMKSIIVWGIGNIFNIFFKVYDDRNVNIVALCDNNISLIGRRINNIKVISPKDILEYSYDYLVITTIYYKPIVEQLRELMDLDDLKIVVLSTMEDFVVNNKVRELIDERCQTETLYRALNEKINGLFIEQMKVAERQLILNAQNLIAANKNKIIDSLSEVEFKVFSQNGEDGIIQWLIHNTEIENKVFVEFGVQNYVESNTRFLLMNNNWSGLIIDGSEENINYVKSCEYYWKYDLQAISKFITKDNINDAIESAGIKGDIGLLSIDIDGNDYWILESIRCISPRILICEFNSLFGADEAITVPYDECFVRTQKHYSNLYYGVSLSALRDWAKINGFFFVGCNTAGNNAFFVRKDCIDEKIIPARAEYVNSKFSESRDVNGRLNYVRGKERIEVIKDMDVFDIRINRIEKIRDLFGI